jgi:hypothetical protein
MTMDRVSCSLEDGVVNAELDRRPSRLPDYTAEHEAFIALAHTMADAPPDVATTGGNRAASVPGQYRWHQPLRAAPRRGGVPAVAPAPSSVPLTPSQSSTAAARLARQRRTRRWAHYDQVWTSHQQGWTLDAIAPQVGLSRRTVQRDSSEPDLARAPTAAWPRPQHSRSVQNRPSGRVAQRVSAWFTSLPDHPSSRLSGPVWHGGPGCPTHAPGSRVSTRTTA